MNIDLPRRIKESDSTPDEQLLRAHFALRHQDGRLVPEIRTPDDGIFPVKQTNVSGWQCSRVDGYEPKKRKATHKRRDDAHVKLESESVQKSYDCKDE